MSHVVGEWPQRLRLDPTAFIAPGAVVVGAVTMGARASVWFNAVVRGDSAEVVIGEASNIQDGTIVHEDDNMPARIGRRVTIGHRAVIHGCTIEDECLIGMGAIVLSGAVIGTGTLIGAGALVRERQVVPPNSLVVGAPARVIGPTTDAHRHAIRNGHEHYAELARSYMIRGLARPHPRTEGEAVSPPYRGPMTFADWHRLIGTLGETPEWVGRRIEHHDEASWRKASNSDRWSALEVLCHLRDADRDVYVPRLERMLGETPLVVEDVDMTGWDAQRNYREQGLREVFDTWLTARRRLLARLTPLGRADWKRLAFHSRRGPFPLGEMVRDWVEHDLAHRRQIALALGENG
jgi:carbonic anhydrase/acetyltransferase-like protein (isoleucine patch superfamily)